MDVSGRQREKKRIKELKKNKNRRSRNHQSTCPEEIQTVSGRVLHLSSMTTWSSIKDNNNNNLDPPDYLANEGITEVFVYISAGLPPAFDDDLRDDEGIPVS